METSPNLWSFLQVLAQVAGTAFTGWLAYKLAIKPRLDNIHTLVNGNLHTALKKVDELRDKLKQVGVDPDA